MELNDLVDSVDILEYISQYTQFEEKGGEYWALSPLKEEETPSFSVNKEMNRFYDFSSGKGGDIISFIKYHDHCNTRQAVETLKRYIGESGTVLLPKRFELYHIAKKFSPRKSNSKASKSAVLPDDYMDRYRRDMGVLQIWKDEGISEESLDKFQVRYDDFSQRIVYPIRSVEGKIINVSGRTIDPEWKEKRQRKYTYFKPLGILDTIYGLAENRQEILRQGEIILFEGAKSVMIADTWGIGNTGAILTSHLNAYQVKILVRLGVRVVFALDKEIDVRADENIMRLRRFVNVEYIRDSDDLLQPKMSPVDAGREIWDQLYENRKWLR